MPNLTQMSRLLRALRQEAKAAKPAGDLEEIMARLPKAPPEVEARVLAEIEARDRARREMYKVPEVDKAKGKKALAEARRILMTPEERAAYEAQLREQGLQSFLEPSAVKNRLYHGTTAHDDYADEEGQAFQQFTGRPTWFAQEPYTASGYSKGTGSTYPVYAQIKNPLKIGFDADDDAEKAFPLARKLGVDVKHIMEMQNPEKAWEVVNHPSFIDAVENAGYDGIQMNEGGYKTYGVFDPRKIKSATGNRGTYDITDPDITKAEGGLAQYGLRHSGEGVKGKGYFGSMAGREGTVTELSAEDESGEYPLVVPTLTAEELDRLLAGGEPTPEMLDKASSWAATRRKRGESPFASPTEVRMPRPKAEGGSIEVDNMDSILERIAADPLLDEAQRKSLIERGKAAKEKQDQLRAELEAALARDYWADRGPNSADELVLEDRPDYRLRKAVEAQYGMSTAIPSYLEKAPPFQLNENYLIDPEFVEERQSRRFYKKGGAVKKAEGGSLTDLPDEVNPSNWREHLQNNVRADARALLGAKDGGVINLDELIEKSLKKKDGGVINLDELIAWTLAKDEHRKMKAGGAVKMADGGQTFPLQRPEEVTDLKPRPRTKRDELLEMLSKGVGSVHEFMAKPFGYENPPGEMVSSLIGLPGTAKTLERMAYGDPLTSGAGMTTNLLPETTEAAFLGLGAAPTALKATKAAGKALAPTAMEMLDVELANMMKPYQMAVAPEGKAGKVKAPANPVGFYNPAEKAALNLQRKKGPGSAFISDLKKQPGVTDERIAELGLTDLASNPNVTREEVIAAVEQNRIPLRESVKREPDREAINKLEEEYQDLANQFAAISGQGNPEEVMRISAAVDKNLAEQNRLKSIPEARFGPSAYPDYSMPGGENYREIRVGLPLENNQEIKVVPHPTKEGYALQYPSGRFVGRADAPDRIGTTDPNFANNWTSVEAAKEYGVPFHSSAFMHRTHHGDEPNVLFHLRVANHVDEEGKKGLLIDELQSDWHQQGREKGYGDKLRFGYSIVEQEPGFFLLKKEGMSMPMASGTKEEIMDRARHYNAIEKGVPDAPFKDNWYQVGLKRAIKEAVDTGMDRVYLTTGARQADRYDLSKQLSRVSYQDGVLHGYDNSGALVVNKAMTPDELPNYVGKDLGKKMVENAQKDAEIRNKISVARYEGRPESEINALRSQLDGVKTDYAGVDLKVGGEGMKQYYDKNYKNYLEKYAKQHGGKLGMTNILTKSPKDLEIYKNYLSNTYGKDSEAYKLMLEEISEPVYYIDLTDAMRESAKKGQSYAYGGGVFNTDPDITDAGRIIPEHTI